MRRLLPNGLGRSSRRGRAPLAAVAAALLLATVACAGTPGSPSPQPSYEHRGFDGMLLQPGAVSPEGVTPPGEGLQRAGVSPLFVFWFPVRLTYGVLGFVLAGDAGPIPFTGFRFLSGKTSPWGLASGEFFLGEDAYDLDEWPDRERPLMGVRGHDPELLPGYTVP